MNRTPNILWVLAIFSAIGAISVFAWFGYLAEFTIPNNGGQKGVQHSALLPVDWQTYYADAWSVGYPLAFEAHTRRDGAVWFLPRGASDDKTYFLVTQEAMSLEAYLIARDAEGYLAPTSVKISNYPAAKYRIGNGRTEYVIGYHDEVIIIASDDMNDETIAIMFATFAMKTE